MLLLSSVNVNAAPPKNINPRVVPADGIGEIARQEFSPQELEKIKNDPILAARIEVSSQILTPAGYYQDNYKSNPQLADARQAYNLYNNNPKAFLTQELPAYIGNNDGTQKIVSKLMDLGESRESVIKLYEQAYSERVARPSDYVKTESQLYKERHDANKGGILNKITPVIAIGLSLFAPGIGTAIGTALGLTGTAAAVVGSAILQGTLAEAQGGDFMDGAIKGAVTAGVAPAVANTVGSTVSNIMADSALKSVVSNAIASSAASAVTAALTGGDVESAALTGALAGAGGSIGRELGTAAELGTTPFSEQTQMLAGQEQGLGTAGGLASNIGQAAGAIAGGVDPQDALLQAASKSIEEQRPSRFNRIFGRRTATEPAAETPVLAPPGAEITTVPPPETGQITDTGVMDGVAGTIPEITPPSTQESPIPDQISQELGGIQEGVAGTIPDQDQQIIDLITQPPEATIPGVQEGIATTIPEGLAPPDAIPELAPPDMGVQEGIVETIPEDLGLQGGIVETIPEDLGLQGGIVETIPEDLSEDPLLGLSSAEVGLGEQEAIDRQALEGLSDASVGLGEEAAIDQANLDALGDLSSAEVGQGEQDAIDRQALEELSSAEVGQGEQDAIDAAALDFQTTPYIRDIYISSGRRQPVMGPTVTTLGQALAAPFFPSSPLSGLTSYRGAGEIESKSTGKPRRDVWNEASLRLKDALGL